MSSISSGTTLTTALVQTADTSGVLQLQTNGGTTALTLDTSQNAGFGVTPSGWTGGPATQFKYGGSVWNNSDSSFHISENAYFNGSWNYISGTSASATNYFQSTGTHNWRYASAGTGALTWTTGMTLDASGNLLVGTTTTNSSLTQGMNVFINNGSTQSFIGHVTGTASGTYYSGYSYNGSLIGSITQNGTTGVLYNLTSDYRLKNNQEDLTGAKDFIMALKPKKWQWWDGSGEGVGFVAHEFMEVAKYSGQGAKDAVDADGKPVYQSIQPSSSEVMANLVSFIQELSAQVTTLQSQVTALQSKG